MIPGTLQIFVNGFESCRRWLWLRPAGRMHGSSRLAQFGAARRSASGYGPVRGLQWRALEPTVQGGRVVDVESMPGEPCGFYVAYASGGVWKSTNNCVRFEPLTRPAEWRRQD